MKKQAVTIKEATINYGQIAIPVKWNSKHELTVFLKEKSWSKRMRWNRLTTALFANEMILRDKKYEVIYYQLPNEANLHDTFLNTILGFRGITALATKEELGYITATRVLSDKSNTDKWEVKLEYIPLVPDTVTYTKKKKKK